MQPVSRLSIAVIFELLPCRITGVIQDLGRFRVATAAASRGNSHPTSYRARNDVEIRFWNKFM